MNARSKQETTMLKELPHNILSHLIDGLNHGYSVTKNLKITVC